MLIRYRTHNRAYSQAIKVIVNKNQASQGNGGQHRALPASDMLLRPVSKGSGTSGFIHQLYHHAQNHQKAKDSHIPGIGKHMDNAIHKYMVQSPLQIVAGIQKGSGQNPQKQRAINFLGNQCQGNRNHRRHQRPGGILHRLLIGQKSRRHQK